MSKTSKKLVKKEEEENILGIVLKEIVEYDVLMRLISAEGLDDKIMTQLKNYRKMMPKKKMEGTQTIPVSIHYCFSKKLKNKGRLYAQGGIGLYSAAL